MIKDNQSGVYYPIAGAGATRVIQLKAMRAGTDVFEMIYARSWEVDKTKLASSPNSGHHILNIKVSEDVNKA